MSKYLFSCGSARGGTGLITRMLSVSPNVEIALDPYLPMFKSLRTAIVNRGGSPQLKKQYDASAPLLDYYYTDIGVETLDLIQKSSLNLDFDLANWSTVETALRSRSLLSSGDLSAHMGYLKAANFSEMFRKSFQLIAEVRKKPSLDWIGVHENWTIEFMPILAREYPDAKFFVVLRDPRAVIASSLNVSDQTKSGHILSYAKCLRKLMGLSALYQKDPLFKNRLLIVKHEDAVVSPEETCKRLCEFLDVEYIPDMLDTSKYIEPSTGGVYNGFSSFESQANGISIHRIHRWKSKLSAEVIDLIDYVCGPEMKLFNFETVRSLNSAEAPPQFVETLRKDAIGEKSWRSDFNDLTRDSGSEFFRRTVLNKKISLESSELSKLFLRPELFEMLWT